MIITKDLTDTQTKTIVKIIDLGNKLAKISTEYKNKLYETKHGILEYIITNKKHLIKSITQMENNDTDLFGKHRLLEVDMGNGIIFHVPYHKKKTYGFNWDDTVVPEIYNKPVDEDEIRNKVLQNYNPSDVFMDLFQIYTYLHGGISKVNSGTIQYWYTKYIMQELHNNQDLSLISHGGNNSNSDTEKYWIKYDLISSGGEILETKEFVSFFKEARRHYSEYFRKSVKSICKEYEQKLQETPIY